MQHPSAKCYPLIMVPWPLGLINEGTIDSTRAYYPTGQLASGSVRLRIQNIKYKYSKYLGTKFYCIMS